VTLKKLLGSYSIGSAVDGSSWARIATEDAQAFMPIAAAGGVDGYTVHNYPYGGHDCTVQNYLNKSKVTGDLAHKLQAVAAVAASVPGAEQMLLVLEETAGSSGGGCENVTDRFVAGFTWMTTLSAVASAGFDRVHRQDIAGWSFAFGQSHYMLVGPAGWTNGSSELLTPHPDWFTTVLFRQNIGHRVLSTALSGGSSAQQQAVDAHFWCSGDRSPAGPGSITLAWANLGSEDISAELPKELAALPSTVFTLSGSAQGTAEADLQSDSIFLNGQLMSVDEQGLLPAYPIEGRSAGAGSSVGMPALSYGFVVFDGGAFPACAA
jgi:heparanase 1